MDITSTSPAFELPDGWILEVRPRLNSRIPADKYYYEPHTGRKFRSLPSIKRYLYGEDEPTRRRKAPKTHHEGAMKFGILKKIVYRGKLWRPEDFEVAGRKVNVGHESMASATLPDGWIVEEVPRRCGVKFDTYYIEPVTRRRFRSIAEVQRYLTTDDEFLAKYKPIQMNNSNVSCSGNGSPSGVPQKSITSYLSEEPPEKITWTLTMTNSKQGHEKWIPFLESYLIPDYVKHIWEQTFFLGMTTHHPTI